MMQFTQLPEPRWLVLAGIVIVSLLALSYGFARGRTQPWVRALCGLLRLTRALFFAGLICRSLWTSPFRHWP